MGSLSNNDTLLGIIIAVFVQLEKVAFTVTIQQLIRYIYRQSNLGKYFLS